MPLSRWSRRHKRTFGKKKEESKVFLEEHRVPPKPTHYYTEDKGKCRYCGHWIYTERGELNTRKSWHSRCADEYMFIYHSGETRKYIWKRDNGECAHCHELFPWRSRRNDEKWDVDHIRPLWEQKGKTFDEIDLTYWEEENLQTLCYKCHKKKSADEAARRAEINREKKK